MKLTFKEAVEQHRKMWNWIADNVEEIKPDYANEIKEKYLKEFFPNELIFCDCFCCKYDMYFENNCKYCPIVWKLNSCANSGYGNFVSAVLGGDCARAAKIAREIANLPARQKIEGE